jgi:tripartite motif-containing protein 71
MNALPSPVTPRISIALAFTALTIVTSGAVRGQEPRSAFPLFAIDATDALGHVREASGLAVAPDGTLFVVDRRADRVQRFGADDVALSAWGGRGSAPGQFEGPTAIAVDSEGQVYVADTGNHRIQRFEASGTFLGQWGADGSGDAALVSPEGVAVDQNSVVYVSDAAANVVWRFTTAGDLLGSFGHDGPEPDRLDRPRQIAIGPDGSIFVLDFGHDRIQRFARDGTRIMHFRTSEPFDPMREDLFLSALAVGADGTVFTGRFNDVYHFDDSGRETGRFEVGCCVISLVSSAGNRLLYGLSSFGSLAIAELDVTERPSYRMVTDPSRRIGIPSHSDAPGQFSVRAGFYPPRVVPSVAPNGRLYVVDFQARRLQWFRSDGLYLGEKGGFDVDRGILLEGLSVGAAPDGSAWVANAGARRLLHIGVDGDELATIQLPGTRGADGIAVAPDGSLFIADATNGLVQHLTGDGVPITAWGGKTGREEGQYSRCLDYDVLGVECNSQPLAIATDASVVYLLDSGNGRVHRYSDVGDLLGTFEGTTVGIDIQDTAQGIAVGRDDTILVSNTATREVLRFSAKGDIIERIVGAPGKLHGRFDRPGGIAVAPDGTWYVSDREHGRVLAYGAEERNAWRVEYFGNPWLTERPLAIVESAVIDFDWGEAEPDPALRSDGWSARFERNVFLSPGDHTFVLETTGGARLWLGDALAVDAWDRRMVSRRGGFDVPPVGVEFARLEFRDQGGPAAVRLTFDGVAPPTEPPDPTRTATATPTPTAPTTLRPLYLPIVSPEG